MSQDAILTFVEHAERHLPSVRSSILVHGQDGRPPSELGGPLRRVSEMRELAARAGLQDIDELFARVETKLQTTLSGNAPLAVDIARRLLDLLARIEASMLNARLQLDDRTMDISTFVDELFDNMQIKPAAARKPESAPDPDEELLEVFRAEAGDLLRNISTNLDVLRQQPGNSLALWEIRRNAHTFKGAAGVVGFKQCSGLAHRIEDLLDHLAETGGGSDPAVFDLLNTSTKCLADFLSGTNPGAAEMAIEAVQKEFDDLMQIKAAGIANPKPDPPPAAPAPIRPMPAAPRHADRRTSSVVRVSLERLDEIMNTVRDMAANRLFFQQGLQDVEAQIHELEGHTSRLNILGDKLDKEVSAAAKETVVFAIDGEDEYVPSAAPPDSAAASNDFSPLPTLRRELAETSRDSSDIHSELSDIKTRLTLLFEGHRRLTEELSERLLRIRMVKFGSLTPRFSRAVQVTCGEENKYADIVIENPELEIDTQILDSLVEPLLHLVKNAVVHGIELSETRRLLDKPDKGRIVLALSVEATHLKITISDDGRGIALSSLHEQARLNGFIDRETASRMTDDEILDLIFIPGLTTAATLNMNAGRGVGMSIVKDSVAALNGTISVATEPQKGTVFTIQVPMAMAISQVLVVRVDDRSFAFPMALVKHITELSPTLAERSLRERTLRLGIGKFPLRDLGELLGLEVRRLPSEGDLPTILVESSGQLSALLVEKVVRTEEVIIRPSTGTPGSHHSVLGVAALASGELVPVIDLPLLFSDGRTATRPADGPAVNRPRTGEFSVLVVDDSPSVRHVSTQALQNEGWRVEAARDGREALEILTLSGFAPDVILTDVEMPRMDGYQFVSELKQDETLRGIPVIMITSRGGATHRDNGFNLGVSEYITKPVDSSEIVDAIKRLTGIREGVAA